MASHCQESERLAVEAHQGGRPTIDYDVQSYAVCAIVESGAFVEARLNEIWLAAREPNRALTTSRLAGLDDDQIDAIRDLAGRKDSERKNVVSKLSDTLACVDKGSIDKELSPGRDVWGLTQLRNALVHFKPELQWDNEVHTLEEMLIGLVPGNPLMQKAKPWFPHQVLCAGVALWACEKSTELILDWEKALGLTSSYSTEHAMIIVEG